MTIVDQYSHLPTAGQRYYARHRGPESEYAKRDKDRLRDYHYKKKYGIGLEDYEGMLRAQGGLCAICRQASSSRLRVDHDHLTDEVRALLCHHCNIAIGLLEEDVDRMRAAIDYLEKYRVVG